MADEFFTGFLVAVTREEIERAYFKCWDTSKRSWEEAST
jgi:hypothetical protein